jgi:hypothetical protein
MSSTISFVDLNDESITDNDNSFKETINTLEKMATTSNVQPTKLVEETKNIGQNNTTPEPTPPTSTPEPTPPTSTPEPTPPTSTPEPTPPISTPEPTPTIPTPEPTPTIPSSGNQPTDGKRSPSYHTSVMNNTNYNTNDQNIFVSAENVEFIEKLYQQLKNVNRGLKLNSKNISMIIVRAVEIVNTWKQIDVDQRDDVVIQALLVLIKDSNVDDDELVYLETTIKSTIGMIFKSITGDVIKKKTRKDNKNRRRANNYVKKHENERVATGQILESIVDKLESVFKRGNYQVITIVTDLSVIVGMVISFVEQYSYLSGMEKKEIAIQSLTIFLTERLPKIVEIDDKTLNIINVSINGLPQLIDLLVSVSNGKFDIKMEDIGKFCIKLLPLIKSFGICKGA